MQLINVTKMFGDFTAVDNLNLSDPARGVHVAAGAQRLRQDHHPADARRFRGADRRRESSSLVSPFSRYPPHKRDVNTVFQAYALFPHMTVAENVAYGLRQKRVGKAETSQRVAEALDMVKMTRSGRAQATPDVRWPAAARRARPGPGQPAQSVLLLDEPLGALDRKLREEMQIELKLLQSQLGITFIFVTHDQEEALSMSDRIAVMLDGRVEQLADPYTIYERPASAFVAGFIGRQNFFAGDAEQRRKRQSRPTGWSSSPIETTPPPVPARPHWRPCAQRRCTCTEVEPAPGAETASGASWRPSHTSAT